MTDLRLERDFSVSPQRLFRAISTRSDLLQWWGPEEVDVSEDTLDFTNTGPWHSVMRNKEGQRFKVSGQVTQVDPPNSVSFTWAWHDGADTRGAESHVTLFVENAPNGARLIIDHRDLGDDDISVNHEKGWSSSLRKLHALLG